VTGGWSISSRCLPRYSPGQLPPAAGIRAAGIVAEQRAILHFDAITYYGTVWINGQRLGEMARMFRTSSI